MSRARTTLLPLAALVVVLAAAPFALPHIGASLDLMQRVLVIGVLGLGFDLLFGAAGLLSFGQAAFFGTGGMVSAYLLVNNVIGSVWLALAIGTVSAGVFGLVVGWLAVRRIGIYFTMITGVALTRPAAPGEGPCRHTYGPSLHPNAPGGCIRPAPGTTSKTSQ